MKIRCPECGTWIYVVESEQKEKHYKEEILNVEILNIKHKNKMLPYSASVKTEKERKEGLNNVLENIEVLANVNGKLYKFDMWWLRKYADGWVGGARSISTYLGGKVKSKDIWADENNEIYVKQKFGIIAGVNKAKMKLPEERLDDISKRLGFKLKIGREGLRLYLDETYSENPPLSKRPKLIEKLIKVWIAFWEPTMV